MAFLCSSRYSCSLWYILLTVIIVDLIPTSFFLLLYGIRAIRYVTCVPESYQERVFDGHKAVAFPDQTPRLTHPQLNAHYNLGSQSTVSRRLSWPYFGSQMPRIGSVAPHFGRQDDGGTDGGGDDFVSIPDGDDTPEDGANEYPADQAYRPSRETYNVSHAGGYVILEASGVGEDSPDFIFMTTLVINSFALPILLFGVWLLIEGLKPFFPPFPDFFPLRDFLSPFLAFFPFLPFPLASPFLPAPGVFFPPLAFLARRLLTQVLISSVS